ncbi:Ionotropic receptor 25a [Eumeta japonica]|uniref:Ionotropic receptor 25a n=1 Tax=Eumeta variegata TaxID=151549 RepID=A0A4C1Y2P3_EUMVA|nr:Ionotropic receptor 25a [Eumeta japonica]
MAGPPLQTPVSSLEQLARQSRINYTVVEGSTVHQYFINMKFAEDTLYRVWKEITLNATTDQAQYRVWDYPIREQYGHILLAINGSAPVPDAETGFRLVNVHTDADFAFIHDSAEIKYEITKNCNLTEVGEIFAEQPYAIAVQQGSRLQEDLSRALLDLQKERFLEQLGSKFFNEGQRYNEMVRRLEIEREILNDIQDEDDLRKVIEDDCNDNLTEDSHDNVVEAKKMKATSDKSHPPANIGDNMTTIPIPDVDKGKGDLRNIIGVILQKNDEGFYKVGTKHGILQKLYYRYWNESARQACPDAEESEGITLESLGGVFIATLFGLGLAMLTLAWEVFYHKRKERTLVRAAGEQEQKKAFEVPRTKADIKLAKENVAKKRRGKDVKNALQARRVTIGDSFKPASEKPGVSFISVYPKSGFKP